MPRKKTHTKESLIEAYMNHAVIHGFDVTTEDFCKQQKIPLDQFVDHLESYEHADTEVWETLMSLSIETVFEDPQYASFDFRQRLLSLYYTFFENCALNAAYCTASIDHQGKLNMIQTLRGAKRSFTEFITTAIGQDKTLSSSQAAQIINKVGDTVYGEGFYGQLLFLLDFWHQDTSLDFEKTDIAIEKAVKAVCDLMDVTPVKSIFDFGKFIWQERIQNKS